jgi:hypothetical protein
LAQRASRKRGRRRRSSAPTQATRSPVPTEATRSPVPTEATRSPVPTQATRAPTRSQLRDAQARARLTPLAAGERPWPIVVGALLTGASGLGNLAAWLAGADIAGRHPAAGGIIAFTVVMLACAVGMWRLWYGAVLGFMVLLAIIIVIFSLLLVEASNALGFVVAPLVVIAAGFLFWKMVRVLGRIQMPRPPGGR